MTPPSSTILSPPSTTSNDLKFSVLASFFSHTSNAKSSSSKRSKFRDFIDKFCKTGDRFSSIRLILPHLDRERSSYGLKESHLAQSLLNALAISRDSEDAKRLINWRKGGAKVAGNLAGNFSLVAADVLQRRQSTISGDMTVREVNEYLDRLASAEKRSSKSDILGEMIRKTNSKEMKWIIMIILKDLKIGITEKSVFQELHPDANDLFNVTCNLRLVCEKLTDRNARCERRDIEVGKVVRPQMALGVSDCGAAWKRLRGKEIVVECKFDGFRMQVHKNGDQVNYYSRNFKEHNEYEHGMSNVIVENVVVDKCILDGEMLIWDSSTDSFAEFGWHLDVAKAAREGLVIDRQLCYVVFDVLYVGDSSVIHQTLKERKELLEKVVRPVKGRLEVLLLPNCGRNDDLDAHRRGGEPCWSVVANCEDDVERFYRETIENRGEGVVLKDLGSKWEPGDKSGKWLKLKPDYGKVGSDLDVLIIGGYYGTGRHGGEVAQFLLGLAERPVPGEYPRRFVSFCKVGTGLSDEELDELVAKLKPYFRRYEHPKKLAPSFYQVTNHATERPDVWVESPEKSVIVTIGSDIRPISSEVFAAPYSLRFPRIDRVRYDKFWHECLDVQSFMELLNSSNGTTRRGGGEGSQANKPKRARNGGKKRLPLTVPSHFTQTDVSSVKGESQIFANMVFHFVNVPSEHSLDSMHKSVVENGGTFSMNINNTVSHCVGAENRGLKFEAAKRRGCDVIHYSWVSECCSQKQLLPLRPNHYIFLSDLSRKRLQEEIDEFSDSYFWDLSVVDLKHIFCNVNRSEGGKIVDHYMKKYCPCEKWGYLHNCFAYFHLFADFRSDEWNIFLKTATRRMRVEVSLAGGKVVDSPFRATHVIIMSIPGHKLEFGTLLQSFPEDQKHIFFRKRLYVVGSQWLEDCLKEQQKMPEVAYSLKPENLEESSSEEEGDESDKDHEKHSAASTHVEMPRKPVIDSVSCITEPGRKRGRSIGTSTRRGKPIVNKPLITKRARVGSRPARLHHFASDDEFSEQETDAPVNASPDYEICDHVFHTVASDYKHSKPEPSSSANCGFETENIELGSRGSLSAKNEENKKDLTKIGNHCLNNPDIVTCSKPNKGSGFFTSGNMEDDPVQAMLLTLIPCLRGKSEAKNGLSIDRSDESSPYIQPKEESSLKPSQV